MTDLRARIDEALERLTPAERVVAEHLRASPDDVVVYSSTELARRAGVSKATVSRLLRSLGWADAQDARADVRAQRAVGVPVGVAADADPEADNLREAFASLATAGEARVAGAIATARRVLILGFRNGFPVALHLREQLAQVRPDVHVAPLPGQSLAQELVGLDASDLVIVFGFRRRPAAFAALVDYLRTAPPRVLLVVDPTASDHLAGHEFGLICPIAGSGAFDSYAAAMGLVARIAASVQESLGDVGQIRAMAIADLYHRLGELESV